MLKNEKKMKLRPDNILLDLYTFPGCGDLSKEDKHKQREGDFLHYHEMLKQIKMLDKNVIFLTSDVKKNDNSTDCLEPYEHYICNCFYLTGHVYYIIDAKSLPLVSQQNMVIDNESDEEDDSDVENNQISSNENISNEEVEQQKERDKNMYFKKISEEIFLDELTTCIKWSNEYGDKYVSKYYFIYGILGHKRYRYANSWDIMQDLISKGKLKLEVNDEGKECLYII